MPDDKSKGLEEWQDYQLSLSKAEQKLHHKAMMMHRFTEDYIDEQLDKDELQNMSDNERDLRIKQLTSQVSQIEHWTFEALREARSARITAQVIFITLLVALISAFIPSLLFADQLNAKHQTIVASVTEDYRKECRDAVNGLTVSGDELFATTSQEGEQTTIIIGRFECKGEGHLWCGTKGCRVDVVVGAKWFKPMVILNSPPNYVSVKNETLTLKSDHFEWTSE